MAADEQVFGADFIDNTEDVVSAGIAQSAIGPLAERIEGVAQLLVDHPNKRELTHLFVKAEPPLHAKMNYLLALTKAVGEQDAKGFHFPDFDEQLLKPDYELRGSFKQQTRKILESITKIFERGGEQSRRGFFGGRRG